MTETETDTCRHDFPVKVTDWRDGIFHGVEVVDRDGRDDGGGDGHGHDHQLGEVGGRRREEGPSGGRSHRHRRPQGGVFSPHGLLKLLTSSQIGRFWTLPLVQEIFDFPYFVLTYSINWSGSVQRVARLQESQKQLIDCS